jgi:Family of unknown function (DUF6361)
MSTFTWLDGSERQQRQMRDLLSQFREKGTRDELGLATIRAAFADMLFPGTGSLQTRARYFLFVPWMYQELERRKVPARDVARRAREFELNLIDVLSPPEQPESTDGAIGVRARRNLQRLASNVYWSGLCRLGILVVPRSQEDFHNHFDAVARPRLLKNDDGEVISGGRRAWAALPAPPPSFPKEATFDLTRDEAAFLVERITFSAKESFLAWWVTNGLPGAESNFAWEAVEAESLGPDLRRQLGHARNFSESMYGASILYNLLLTTLRKQESQRDDLVATFDQWHDRFRARSDDFRSWDLDDFWRCAIGDGGRVGGPMTRAFVESWVKLAIAYPSATSIREGAEPRELIKRREEWLKRGLARFSNARALELWGGSSGLGQIDFRWGQAKRLGADIRATRNGGRA